MIWPEVGKLNSYVVNVVLDEIMRAAVDGGIGSARCEVMAEIINRMCSKSARGRILSKLRKVRSVSQRDLRSSRLSVGSWEDVDKTQQDFG